MLITIKSFLNKLLSVFAVTDDRYTITQIPNTSNEAGMVYCLTEKTTEKLSNVFVYCRGRDTLAGLCAEYVTYSIDTINRTSLNQPTVTLTIIKNPEDGKPIPLADDHRAALFSYFEERRIRRLESDRPANGVVSTVVGTFMRLSRLPSANLITP